MSMENINSNNTVILYNNFELDELVEGIRQRALVAIRYYTDNSNSIPYPLDLIHNSLSSYKLCVSKDIGERGFLVNESDKFIAFNAGYIGCIRDDITEMFIEKYKCANEDATIFASEAISLYIFHELFHINQNFIDHELATIIKGAFGPDELSKIDVYADVIAAHCLAFVQQSEKDNTDWNDYIVTYAANITLSYNVLTRSFSNSGDHKKRRALGLLTSRLLIEYALDAKAANEDNEEIQDLPICPIYTSVSQSTGHIIALSSRENAWGVLFYAQVDDHNKLAHIWNSIAIEPDEDIIAMMMPLCEAAMPKCFKKK